VNEIKSKIVEKAFRKIFPAKETNGKFELWASECSKPLLLILDNFDWLLHYQNRTDLDFFDTGNSGIESYLTRTTVIVTSREEITHFQYPDVHSYPLAQLQYQFH